MEKELKQKIEEYLQENHKEEEIYIDYRDFDGLVSLVAKSETVDDFIYELDDAYYESRLGVYEYVVDEVAKHFGIESYSDDYEDLIELVNENVEVSLDVKRFLDYKVKTNVMSNHYKDSDCDFTGTGWLHWLMNSQGYKMNDYPVIKQLAEYRHLVPCGKNSVFYEDPNENDWAKEEASKIKNGNSKFLKSLLREVCELPIDYMRTLVFLTEMTIEDYFKMKNNKDYKEITFKTNTMCGLFDCWCGSGSILEIELEKDVTINKDNIYQVQLEDCHSKEKPYIGYSVNSVYGLVGSCWQGDYSMK